MMVKVNNDKFILSYLTVLFLMMNIVSVFQIFFDIQYFKPFIVLSILSIVASFISFKYIINIIYGKNILINKLDIAVIFFLLISLFSYFFYFQPDNPASAFSYTYGLYYGVFPIFLFFTGRVMSTHSKNILIERIIFINLLIFVFGILLFFIRPQIYTDYLFDKLSSRGVTDLWQVYGRFQSYLGSTSVGTIGIVTFALMPKLKIKSDLLKFAIYSILIIGVFLSQQRSSMIILSILILKLLFIQNQNINKKIALIIAIPIFVVLLFSFIQRQINKTTDFDIIKYSVENRIDEMNIKKMFTEREGYRTGFISFSNFPFGLGIGATLSATQDAGLHPNGQVVDANYMRILADLGFIGLTSFLLIIFMGLKFTFKKEREIFIVIAIFFLQAFGTNVFDTFYSSQLFWVLLGLSQVQIEEDSLKYNIKEITN